MKGKIDKEEMNPVEILIDLIGASDEEAILIRNYWADAFIEVEE